MTRWIKVVAWATVYAAVAWAILAVLMLLAMAVGHMLGPHGLALVIVFAGTVAVFIPVVDQ